MDEKQTHVEAVALLDKFAAIASNITGFVRTADNKLKDIVLKVDEVTSIAQEASGVISMFANDFADYLDDLINNAYDNADISAERIFGSSDSPVTMLSRENLITEIVAKYNEVFPGYNTDLLDTMSNEELASLADVLRQL